MVTEDAIVVAGLGKSYFLHGEKHGRLLSSRLGALARRPAAWLRGKKRESNGEEFWALRDVSFRVARGEVLGIVGRNGAGKSTLLKILTRITEPTEGRVQIRGRVASLLEVGTGFHAELTGRENIYLNGAILGMTRAEIRGKLDDIVAFAEVERFLDTPVKFYSSGMYVRLAFAVAAHLEPDVLIVDEVLAVGDLEFQRKCLGRLNKVSKSGRTVLFVSHNLEALRAICQNGILLDRGRVVATGTIADVIGKYQRPQAEIAANFAADLERPSITSIRVDPERLAAGELRVELAFASPVPLQGPITGVIVSNADGRPLFGTNMRMHPPGNSEAASSGRCTLIVPNLPLHSGIYSLSATLADVLQEHDNKPEAVSFPFVSGNFYPTRPPLHLIGPLDLACQWSWEK